MRDQVHCPRAVTGAVHSPSQAKCDISSHSRQYQLMIRVLEHEAMGPFHHDATRVWGQESAQGPEQCGLAAAIWSQQDVERSLWDLN